MRRLELGLYLWIMEGPHRRCAKQTVLLAGTFNSADSGLMKCIAITTQGPVVCVELRHKLTGLSFLSSLIVRNIKESRYDLVTLWFI